MSTNVGDLVIGLRADIARLQTDMTAAKASVSGAMKDIETYVGFAKTAFLGLGGVLTFSAFKGAIDGAIEFKARLVDLSSQTGIGVTALGALGKTGKLTGTSLDDIAAASAKLSKAIETQNEDSKGAAQAIAALGLNFNQFKQLRPEEQMLTVAKAMAGFADGTGKTADAMLLFGKTGATLLPFLRDLAERTDLNSRQTEEASKQAKQYEDNLKKLAAAGEEWKGAIANAMLPTLVAFTNQLVEAHGWGAKFAVVLQNIKTNLGISTGPLDDQRLALQKLNGEISAVGKRYEVLKAMADSGAVGDFFMGDKAEKARLKLEGLQRQALTASQALVTAANIQTPLVDPMRDKTGWDFGPKPKIKGLGGDTAGGAKTEDLYAKLIKTVNERIAQQETEADKGRKLTDIENLQAKAYADIDGGTIKATLSQKLYLDGLFQTALAEERLAKEREESAKENEKTLDDADRRLQGLQAESLQMKQQLDDFGLTREELQAVSAERDRYTAAQLKGRAAALDTVGAEGQLRELYLAQADALGKIAAQKDELAAKEARERNDPNAGAARAIKEYLADIQRAGDATYGAVQNSLRSLEDTTVSILGGGTAKQAARQWVNGVISELQRLYVVKPLLNDIFNGGQGTGGSLIGSLGSLIGAVGGLFSGGVGITNDTTGSLVSNGLGGGRAAGGPVSAGQSYLVGERGPEILRMGNQAGAITPNGGVPNIQIFNETGTAIGGAKTNQLPDGTLQIFLAAAKAAVADDLHSGGAIAEAVGSTFQLNRAASAPRY